jgi:NAD(P)-dependent dehydrogenase (short-subunit alcohol dehydrogenase family)
MAEPGDIASAAVLVASDDAGWITGQSILANGGNAFSI